MAREGPAGKGRIMVALGSAPNSATLVGWASRMAGALGWEWLAVHVDPGHRLSHDDAERLDRNLALARRLGAEVLVLEAPEVASAIVDTARDRQVDLVVVGRSGLSRLGLLPRRPTISDRIVREADPIDVAVVQDAEVPRDRFSPGRIKAFFESPPREYLLLAASFVAVTALNLFLLPLIGHRSVALVYLAAVLGLSFLARPAPVAIFAVLSALVLNFFFMMPRYSLRIATAEDLFLFVTYFLVAFVTGALVTRLRLKERMILERERRNAFLLASTQKLAECRTAAEAAASATAIIREFCAADAFFLLPSSRASLEAIPVPGHAQGLDGESLAAAGKALAGLRVAGRGTGLSPEAPFRCVPAEIGEACLGVIAIGPAEGRPWRAADDGLILSLGRTFAFIVERERAEELREKAALALESERLSKVLLDSVSHELRTPLTTITGSISALRDERLAESPAARTTLVDGALEAADRLNRIVEDILSMSRIESGSLRTYRTIVDLPDLANEALALAGEGRHGGRIRLSLPADARPATLDFGLASRLAANLLRNAARYSPPGTEIDFRLEEEGPDLLVRVRDRGPGVGTEELHSIFERFSRGRGAAGGGLGLGLAICKGIAAAHGGSIEAHNAEGGGFEVIATFPSCVDWRPA